jgi:hypothetical protein
VNSAIDVSAEGCVCAALRSGAFESICGPDQRSCNSGVNLRPHNEKSPSTFSPKGTLLKKSRHRDLESFAHSRFQETAVLVARHAFRRRIGSVRIDNAMATVQSTSSNPAVGPWTVSLGTGRKLGQNPDISLQAMCLSVSRVSKGWACMWRWRALQFGGGAPRIRWL